MLHGEHYTVTLNVGGERVVSRDVRTEREAYALAEKTEEVWGYTPDIHKCWTGSNNMTATRIYPAR